MKSRIKLVLMVMLVISITLPISASVKFSPEQEAFLQKYAEIRYLSEIMARYAVRNFGENKSLLDFGKSEKKLEQVKIQYELIMAKGNSVVELMKLHVMSNSLEDAELQKHIESLKTMVVELQSLSEMTTLSSETQLTLGITSDRIPTMNLLNTENVGEIIEGTFSGITKSFISIWSAIRKWREEDKEEMIEYIETFKWKEWDEITGADAKNQ